MSHGRRKSFSLTLHVPLLEVWKAAHSATWVDQEIMAPAHEGIVFSQQKFLEMLIQVPVQCFWLNWSPSQVQILLCQQPSQAAQWHQSQRICPRWAERTFPVPSQEEQTETWENKFSCSIIMPDITELVHLKWHIQLRRVKVLVCSKDDCVSCDKSLQHPFFKAQTFFFIFSALPHSFTGLTGSSPIWHSLGHSHVLGAQSLKYRITSWVCGRGSDNLVWYLASGAVTHWLSIPGASFALTGAGLEKGSEDDEPQST